VGGDGKGGAIEESDMSLFPVCEHIDANPRRKSLCSSLLIGNEAILGYGGRFSIALI